MKILARASTLWLDKLDSRVPVSTVKQHGTVYVFTGTGKEWHSENKMHNSAKVSHSYAVNKYYQAQIIIDQLS